MYPNNIFINPENNNFMTGFVVFPKYNNQLKNDCPMNQTYNNFKQFTDINLPMNQPTNINIFSNNLPIDNNMRYYNNSNAMNYNNNQQMCHNIYIYNNRNNNMNNVKDNYNMGNNRHTHYNINIYYNNNIGMNKHVYDGMEKPKMECSLNNNNNEKSNLIQIDKKKVSNNQSINISENYNQIKGQNSPTNDIVIELTNSDTDNRNEIQENTLNPINLFTSQNEEKKIIDEIIDNFSTNDEDLLKILFNSIADENNPNIITFDSYKKNLKKIGETQSDKEIEEMFLKASQNGKLELTFDEYCNAIKMKT